MEIEITPEILSLAAKESDKVLYNALEARKAKRPDYPARRREFLIKHRFFRTLVDLRIEGKSIKI